MTAARRCRNAMPHRAERRSRSRTALVPRRLRRRKAWRCWKWRMNPAATQPLSARGSAASLMADRAGLARLCREGPISASRWLSVRRRGLSAAPRVQAAWPVVSAPRRPCLMAWRRAMPARRRRPAWGRDRAVSGNCMRVDPRRRRPRRSRTPPPCRRHAGQLWRRVCARTGYPRMGPPGFVGGGWSLFAICGKIMNEVWATKRRGVNRAPAVPAADAAPRSPARRRRPGAAGSARSRRAR